MILWRRHRYKRPFFRVFLGGVFWDAKAGTTSYVRLMGFLSFAYFISTYERILGVVEYYAYSNREMPNILAEVISALLVWVGAKVGFSAVEYGMSKWSSRNDDLTTEDIGGSIDTPNATPESLVLPNKEES